MKKLTVALLLVLAFAMPAFAVSFTENWNCANSASPTCQQTWTEFENSNWGISSNKANFTNASNNTNAARADVDLATGDQQVQATLITLTGGNSANLAAGVICRKDSSATATYYAFRAVNQNNGGNLFYDIIEVTAGTENQLTSNVQDPALNDVMKFTCVTNGATVDLTAFVNGTQIMTTNDATPISSSNLRTGIYGFADAITMTAELDNFSAQDFAGGGAAFFGFAPLTGVGK